jgi:hypothetical protein
VLVRGAAALERVSFSGHSRAAAQVEPGGALSCTGCVFDGTIPGTDGVVATGAAVRLDDARFTGGFGRGVSVSGGEVRLTRVHGLGPRTLLHALDAGVYLEDVDAAGGRGPALFVSGGSLQGRRISVDGHEDALLAARAKVDVQGLTSRGSRCGLALLQVTGRLGAVRVERSGSLGALQLLDDDLAIDGLDIRSAQATGVLVRKGSARLSHVRIEGVAREGGSEEAPEMGDGFQVRDAVATLEEVEVRDAEGSALVATAFATVTVGTLLAERSGSAAVVVDRGASLDARRLTVRGARGPGLLLTDSGHARVGRLEVSGAGDAAWAECERGAWGVVGRLESGGEVQPSRCLRVGEALPAP